MKKGTKKVATHLIVDEFQKIKKSPMHPNQKPSHSSHHPSSNMRVEDVACRYCHKHIGELNLAQHQKICGGKLQEDDYYNMLYQRPQHNQRHKQEKQEPSIRKERINCNDDYYPQQDNPNNTNHINKSKRPMSAMNKKNQQKQKVQPKQLKLKKAISTSKLKDQTKKSQHASKEKGEKSKPSSKYEHIYLKNIGIEKKHPLSIGAVYSSKLKKKNANAAQRFMSSQQHSIEQKPQRAQSRSKKEERVREGYRFQEQEEYPQQQTIRHKQQIRLDPQITTQKLKQIVRQKLKHDHHQEREKNQQPRREANHQSTQRQPVRTEVRNQREPQHHPRQPRQQRQQRRQRQNRNQFRNPSFQRYPRRNQERRRQGPNILHIVSQTISNQLQMMKSNQFSMMSNIFENFNNFVNINIESHPNYYQFTNQELNTSSEYDSDSNSSNNSQSSDYDDYYEQEEPEGMDEEQLNSIANKRYRVAEHGHNQCTICLVELKNGDLMKQLFCDHMFHSECIEEWLRRKSACPVCRDQLGNN